MIVEELRAVVGMQMEKREGKPIKDPLETRLHRRLPASQDCGPFTPPRGDINQLQGMDILACRTFSAVMDQIDLERSRCRRLPRDASHRHGA